MNQDQFILAHEQQWLILEVLLTPQLKPEMKPELKPEMKPGLLKQQKKRLRSKKPKVKSPNEEKIAALNPELITQADFPSLYRQVCQHLSLAQSRRYSPYLIERLSFLVAKAHQVFYRQSHDFGDSAMASLLTFFSRTFPQTVRSEINWLWLSSACFYLPLFFMIVIIQFWPEFVYSILPPDSVLSMETMYDPQAEHIGRERGSDSDSLMFGFYIFNNTSIGFRTFATGLIFGIGSLFTLVFNGLHIGAIAGHLTQIGYGATFWSFVVGHSAMELTAIALSGAAGLKLGFSLLIPGRKSRYQALQDAAKVSVKIMAGAVVLFFAAAFVEAFWSSTQTIADSLKYTVGAALWFLVISYFTFVGRKSEQIQLPSLLELDSESGKKQKKVADES